MLTCKEVAQQASDYMDEPQPLLKRWSFRVHLLMCGNCRRFMQHLGLCRQVRAGKGLESSNPQHVADTLAAVAAASSEDVDGSSHGRSQKPQ